MSKHQARPSPIETDLPCDQGGAAAVELKFGPDETELELPRLRIDRRLSSDRRRGDRGDTPMSNCPHRRPSRSTLPVRYH
jgi:hypothetical protein